MSWSQDEGQKLLKTVRQWSSPTGHQALYEDIQVTSGSPKEDGPVLTELTRLEGPSTQYLRTLVPNTIKSMVFGTRILKYSVLGPPGLGS